MATSRPIVASYYLAGKLVRMRHYARLTTAMPRALTILMQEGQPKDVVEFAHAEFGFQIGTVKIHAGGRIDIKFEKEFVDAPAQ